MNSNANDRYGSSLDRTLGASKPVDPATRLSELLAQSLDELTRPFDPPKPGLPPNRPERASEGLPELPHPEPEAHDEPHPDGAAAEPAPPDSRIDADRALAELEAELFAAAKQVDREAAGHGDETGEAHTDDAEDHDIDHPSAFMNDEAENRDKARGRPLDVVPQASTGETSAVPDADAARLVARVRRLMLVSMAVTVIAVGSVFGFIGYRVSKGDGTAAKTADKLPESSPIPTDVTLSLPRGARVVQSAVSNDRLVMTLEIDGKIEVRTFDVKTLQPTGRLNFSATP